MGQISGAYILDLEQAFVYWETLKLTKWTYLL